MLLRRKVVASVEAARDDAGPSPVKAARRRLDDVMGDVARLKWYRRSRHASRGQLALLSRLQRKREVGRRSTVTTTTPMRKS